MKAKHGEVIDVMDGTASAFGDLVQFVYKEEHFEKFTKVETCEDVKLVLDLAHLAHKYEIHSLVNYTNRLINQSIIIQRNNVISILQDIESYKLNLEREYYGIRTICYLFMENNNNLLAIFFKNDSLEHPEVTFVNNFVSLI